MSLQNKHCIPCEGNTTPLTPSQENMYLSAVPAWNLHDAQSIHSIRRNYQCKNFRAAIDFINAIAMIAEKEGHHPDIRLYNYRKVEISLTTHAIGGLSENDFIMASRIDALADNMQHI